MDNGRAAPFSIEMTGNRKDAFYVILNFTFYILHFTFERDPFDCAGKAASRRADAEDDGGGEQRQYQGDNADLIAADAPLHLR